MSDRQKDAEDLMRQYPNQTNGYTWQEVATKWEKFSDDYAAGWLVPDDDWVNQVFGHVGKSYDILLWTTVRSLFLVLAVVVIYNAVVQFDGAKTWLVAFKGLFWMYIGSKVLFGALDVKK